MMNDTISDLLTRIRNAQQVGQRATRVTVSRMGEGVLKVLKGEGFIESFERRPDESGKFEEFEVVLKYFSKGRPLISRAERVSKPGRRSYAGKAEIPHVKNGLGVSIVSTSNGIMADREARKLGLGGEIVAIVS